MHRETGPSLRSGCSREGGAWTDAARAPGPGLLQETFFAGAEAEDAVDGVGGAVVGGVEVADLELSEEADAEHLDAGEDEDAGDDEDGAVLIENVPRVTSLRTSIQRARAQPASIPTAPTVPKK